MGAEAIKTIGYVATGGTIASVGRDSLDLFEYASRGTMLSAVDFLRRIPELRQIPVEVRPFAFPLVHSSAISTTHWLDLLKAVDAAAASTTGVVVTHGTATLEETAYFLHLTLKTDKPVVLVGAQRPINGISSDGPLNFLDAVRVAASPAARKRGVVVVINNEIHCAREVTKRATSALDAFESPDSGPIGTVAPDGSVHFYRTTDRRHAPDTEFNVHGLQHLPRVDILLSYAGSDGIAVPALTDAGAQAIVVATLPPGMITPGERAHLEHAAAKGTIVVLSSRAGRGRITVGSQFVAGDNLTPQKARVLTILGLTASKDPRDIARMFREY